MKKFFIATLITLFVYSVAAVYLIPFFYDINAFKKVVIDKTRVITSKDVNIQENIELSVFPYPTFKVSSVQIRNVQGFSNDYMLSAEKAEATPSFFSLLFLSPRIAQITLYKPNIDIEVISDGSTNINFPPQGNEITSIPRILFKDGTLTFRRNNNAAGEISLHDVTLRQVFSANYILSISGNILIGEQPISLDAMIGVADFNKLELPMKAEISVPDAKFSAEGKIISWIKDPQFVGTGNLDINNIMAGATSFLKSKNIKTAGSLSEQSLNLSGDIQASLDGAVFGGVLKYANATGSGKLEYNPASERKVFFNGALGSINLDQVLGGVIPGEGIGSVEIAKGEELPAPEPTPKKTSEGGGQEKSPPEVVKNYTPEKFSNTAFSWSKRTPIYLLLKVDEVIVNGKKISGISFETEFSGYKITVKDFSLQLPGDTKMKIKASPELETLGEKDFRIDGSVNFAGSDLASSLEVLKKFQLNIPTISITQFNIDVDFILSGGKIYIPKFKAQLEDSIFEGQFLQVKDEIVSYEAIIRANKLNIDNLLNKINLNPAPPTPENVATNNIKTEKKDSKNLGKEETDVKEDAPKAAEEKKAENGGQQGNGIADTAKTNDLDDGLTIFDKMRMLPFALQLSLQADEIVYLGQPLKDNYTQIKIGQGIFSVDEIKFTSEAFGALSGNMYIDSNNLRPQMKTFINSEKLDTANFFNNPIIKNLVEIIGNGEAQVLQPESIKSDASVHKGIWSIEPFNFQVSSIFDGNVDLTVKNMQVGKATLQNVEMALQLTQNAIYVKTFRGNLFEGTIDIKANIATTGRPAASITYALSNANLQQALNTSFGLNRLGGKFSISGSLSVSGFDLNAWISQASGSAAFVIRNGTFLGFDLNYLRQYLTIPRSTQELQNTLNIAFTHGSSSIDYAGGNIIVSDGILTTKNMLINAPFMYKDTTYEGKINLSEWTVDSDFLLMGLIGKYSEIIPVRFILKGSLDKPTASYDDNALRAYWEKQKISGL